MSRKRANATKDKERGFPTAIAWIAFLVLVIVGAGFISSPNPGRQVLGFALLFAPLLIFSVLMALYYWRSKRHMQAMVGGDARDDVQSGVDDDATN